MQPNVADSAAYRWLNKPVLVSRPLDDMEDLAHWSSFTTSGVAIVDARVVSKTSDSNGTVAGIRLSTEQVHHGAHSLLMRTPTRLAGLPPANGRHWGRSGIRRLFDGEDWSTFNRLSFWIYADLPGFYTAALDLKLYNDGVIRMPPLFGQEGETSLILRNHEWHHIVWEIGNVPRDKITALEMSYGLSGHMPEEADSIQFYFDQLDLERVDPDKTEGWDVWPGRISFSHTGYQAGAVKTAIMSGVAASTFSLVDQGSGEIVLSKAIRAESTHLGNFQVMDFSEVRKPGLYVLRAGAVTSQPFRIGDDVWQQTIEKALNFFYMERCGMEVPGVHSICHRDWTCLHDGKRILINGGWHDAGDLSQGLENTGEIDYALFALAEQMHDRQDDPALYRRVLEEARWGLDWILKTSFGDGFRNGGSINSRRTDNIIGDDDDITATARNSPMTNFEAAAVEALAFRVLKDSDPQLAGYALRTAKEDWLFALAGMRDLKPAAQLWRGTFDSDGVEHELLSQAIIASIDLWKATGDAVYRDKAVEWSGRLMEAQQRQRPDWEIPMTGFFYTNAAKERILHYCHRGREQGAMLALTGLCQTFPNHPDYMKWYSSVTLYSEYLKKISQYTAPYYMMPSSIYVDSEYRHVPESRMPFFRRQVLNGIPLGKGHYLRMFPVWMDYRGNFGTILPQGQALAAAGVLRNDLASSQLAQHQLEWIVGRNPFSASTMYGEGYDFAPLYTPSSGDMVGGLPVGIQSKGDDDAPYWPVQAMWTYKEIWVHPVTRWVWLLKDLAGPAIVEGVTDSEVRLTPVVGPGGMAGQGNEPTIIQPGHFSLRLPEGNYRTGDGQVRSFLPGGKYFLDLRADKVVDMDVSQQRKGDEVVIRVSVRGQGVHRLTVKADNLSGLGGLKEVMLKPGVAAVVEWRGRVVAPAQSWVALVVPDGDVEQRKEIRE